MKLTEHNFIDADDWDAWWLDDYNICISGKNNPIKKQILENQEKAEKWDKFHNHIREIDDLAELRQRICDLSYKMDAKIHRYDEMKDFIDKLLIEDNKRLNKIVSRIKEWNHDLLGAPIDECPVKWVDYEISNYLDNHILKDDNN